MGLIARQSFKAGAVTYAGVAIGVVNSLYIYTKMLTVEQLGEITFMYSTVSMFAPFILFGLGNALVKFYPKVKGDVKLENTLFTTLLIIVLSNIFVFTSLTLFFREEFFNWLTNEESILMATNYAIIGMACMQTLMHFFTNVASIKGRIAIPSLLVQIIKVVQPALVILLFMNIISFQDVINGILFYYITLAAIYIYYATTLISFKPSFAWRKLPFSLKSVTSFALFSVLGSIGGVLTNQVDVLMVTNLLGKYDAGLYGWSLFFITVIAIPYSIIGSVSTPIISQHWKENRFEELNKVYGQSSSTLLVISLGLFVCIYAGIDELVALMPKGDEYRLARILVFLLCIAKIIDMATGLNNQIIAMSDSYRYLLFFLLIAVISNIGLNLFFIPKYGIEGSAIATIISIFLYNGIKFWFLRIKYHLNPFSYKTIYILLLGCVILLCLSLLPRTSYPLLNLIFFTGAAFIVYFLVAYKLKLAPELNNFVNKQLLRFGIRPFDRK